MFILRAVKLYSYCLDQRFAHHDDKPLSFNAAIDSLDQDGPPTAAQPFCHKDDSVANIIESYTLCQVIVDHLQANGYTWLARNQSPNNTLS